MEIGRTRLGGISNLKIISQELLLNKTFLTGKCNFNFFSEHILYNIIIIYVYRFFGQHPVKKQKFSFSGERESDNKILAIANDRTLQGSVFIALENTYNTKLAYW